MTPGNPEKYVDIELRDATTRSIPAGSRGYIDKEFIGKPGLFVAHFWCERFNGYPFPENYHPLRVSNKEIKVIK